MAKRKKKKLDLRTQTEQVGCMFLDSGAHSLYNKHVFENLSLRGLADRSQIYAFYETPEYWGYVDRYAEYVKANLDGIDYYVNVDAIFDPDISWRTLKYLENEHGLSPVPVIHHGTELKWFERHLEAGYEFIGVGGVGQGVGLDEYFLWADRVYQLLCPASNGHKPIVRTHGFAMTAYRALIRYPWWSVDSASWVKSGGFGMMYVPRQTKGDFDFGKDPYTISISATPPNAEKEHNQERLKQENRRAFIDRPRLAHPAIVTGKSFHNMTPTLQRHVLDWLDRIGVPLGSIDEAGQMVEWGAMSHHAARKIANLHFFTALCDWLPEWPWPFKLDKPVRQGFF